jgi:predicted permease
MRTLIQDVRYSLRLLARHRGFTATAVVVLALGIGVNTSIFTLLNAVLFRPLPGARSSGSVVGIYPSDRTLPDSFRALSYPELLDVREAGGPFVAVAGHDLTMVGVTEGETTRRTLVDVVTADYFGVLGVALTRGRAFTREEEQPGRGIPVAVASDTYWARTGYDPAILGRVVRLNGRDFTIVGVAPRGFTGTGIAGGEFWLPLGMHEAVDSDFAGGAARRSLADRATHRLVTIGRLKPGVSAAQADQMLAALAGRIESAWPAENKNLALIARPLSRVSITTRPTDDSVLNGVAILMQGLAATVLLIACLNLANMLLAHGATRGREFAIRQAIGGGRWRLVRQLLTEGAVLALAGGAAGLVAAYWGTRLLMASMTSVLPIVLALDPTPDWRVLSVTLTFSAVSTLVFGLWPALKLARRSTVTELKEQAGEVAGGRGRRFSTRNLLVTAQISLSLALLVVSGLFVRAALAGARTDGGFDVDRLVIARVDPRLIGYDDARAQDLRRVLMDRLRALPGVEAATMTTQAPFGEMTISHDVQRDGPPLRSADPAARGRLVDALYYAVGADYFRTIGLRPLRGREFTLAEELHRPGVVPAIIDEPLARRLFGASDPIGQRVRFTQDGDPLQGASLEIVGLVPGTRHDLDRPESEPHVYVPSSVAPRQETNIYVRAPNAAAVDALTDVVRRTIVGVDAQLPIIRTSSLAAHRDASMSLWLLRTAARMFTVLGLAAAFVAVVGLYGVKSYIVSRRTREFGIRMALGAAPADVLRMVFREGMWLAAAGVSLGLGIAALLARLVAGFLYEVSPLDLPSFVGASLLLLTSTLAAAWAPARRAGKVQPMSALRMD